VVNSERAQMMTQLATGYQIYNINLWSTGDLHNYRFPEEFDNIKKSNFDQNFEFFPNFRILTKF